MFRKLSVVKLRCDTCLFLSLERVKIEVLGVVWWTEHAAWVSM